MAVASARPCANLHLDPDTYTCQHPTTQFFTSQMSFLLPNQQRQSTEGIVVDANTHNCFTALWILSGTTWVSRYQKKHSPLTPIVVISYPLSASSTYYNPLHPPCSIYTPDTLFLQSLSKFSLVYYLLVPHLPLHTPYISSPNQCLLFTAYAHTIPQHFVHEAGIPVGDICSGSFKSTVDYITVQCDGVCKSAYLVHVPGQDKLGGLCQEGHLA